MTALHESPPSIPPSQDDVDEVEELRRERDAANRRHAEASAQAVAACARITTRRAYARQRTRTKPPLVGKT